ncbi:hypothetical protein OA328_02715 [Paracoccaceae bacterium]|nr:hypothetical protein [Paracoccaceae bacterium]
MSIEFNPVGRNCLVFSKEKKNGKQSISFEGVSVGYLLDHVGIEGSLSSDRNEVSIEWFPKKWILSGRIKFLSTGSKNKSQTLTNNHDVPFRSNKIFLNELSSATKVEGSSTIDPLLISKLPEPVFGSIVRYISKDGCCEMLQNKITKEPSEEAVAQYTIASGLNEIVNISLVPKLEDMISKEDTGVNWLDTVEDMLVKFPNGSRTDASSGPVLQYLFNIENARKYINDSWVMSVVRMRAKEDSESDLVKALISQENFPRRILRCIIQTNEREFVIINQDSIEARIEDEEKLLAYLDSIEHLLEFFKDSRTDPRSGIVTSWYNYNINRKI